MRHLATFFSRESVVGFFQEHFGRISADTLGWLATILIQASTVPTLLAIMAGLTDHMPPIDLVLFAWASLVLLFLRAVILKDMLNVTTIGIGFIIQAVLMALILFK
jgi:hypothetical protein